MGEQNIRRPITEMARVERVIRPLIHPTILSFIVYNMRATSTNVCLYRDRNSVPLDGYRLLFKQDYLKYSVRVYRNPIHLNSSDSHSCMSELTSRPKAGSWLTNGLPSTDAIVAQLPPSAKLVLCYLRDHRSCTHAEAKQALCLPASTTKHALAKLKDENLVEDRPSVRDARVTVYEIVQDIAGEETSTPIIA